MKRSQTDARVLARLGGVWSAAPTPFTERMEVDTDSVHRMVEHHVGLGIKGLFLAGTNGEGPWMTERQKRVLLREASRSARGRLAIAMQVSDNSSARILDNIENARKYGADIAVIAPPYFLFNATPANIIRLYQEAIRKSALPIGIYDRGASGAVPVPDAAIRRIYMEENVILVKDSSMSPKRMAIALAARGRRPGLKLLNGWEFHCVEYLKAGYDGLLLGGGVFNGFLANKMMEAARAGDFPEVKKVQARMNRIMYAVYGGKKITCWLSGEKKLLVEMGILRSWKNYPDYPLTASCMKAIRGVLARDADVLLPGKERQVG